MRNLNIQQLMREAQKVQKELALKQEELALKTFEAAAGGGMVTAIVNGKSELMSLKIDPSIVDPKDIDMLQDLVVAAINEASGRAKQEAESLLGGMMGGGMPDMGSLFG